MNTWYKTATLGLVMGCLPFTTQATPPLADLLAAELAITREIPAVALENYLRLGKAYDDAAIRERATRVALTFGTAQEALDMAKLWGQSAPKSTEARLIVAVLYTLNHHPKEAAVALTEAVKIEPDNIAHLAEFYRQFSSEERQDALAILEAVARAKVSLQVDLILAEIAYSEGDLALSQTWLNGVLSAPQVSEEATLLQVLLYEEQNLQQEALAYMEKTIAAHPDFEIVSTEYFDALLQKPDLVKAKAVAKTLAARPNLAPDLALDCARLALENAWYTEAKPFLERAHSDPRTHNDANYFLGRLEELTDHPEQAIKWYKNVEPSDFHVLAYTRAALLLHAASKTDEGLALLAQVECSDPIEAKHVLLTTAEVLHDAKRFAEGLAVLTNAHAHFADDVDVNYAKGVQLIALGRIQEAESQFTTVLKKDPEHVEALQALGALLINQAERLSEAHVHLDKALTLDPHNPAVLASIAHLGEVLWHHGDQHNAQTVWQKAYKTAPDNAALQTTMKRYLGAKILP